MAPRKPAAESSTILYYAYSSQGRTRHPQPLRTTLRWRAPVKCGRFGARIVPGRSVRDSSKISAVQRAYIPRRASEAALGKPDLGQRIASAGDVRRRGRGSRGTSAYAVRVVRGAWAEAQRPGAGTAHGSAGSAWIDCELVRAMRVCRGFGLFRLCIHLRFTRPQPTEAVSQYKSPCL